MTLGPRDAILGNASATVTLIEYGDYQCPYCVRIFQPDGAADHPELCEHRQGTVGVPDFAFLGPESTAAANAAQCAEDQNKLWPYHDALYAAKLADDSKGGSEDDGFYTAAELLKACPAGGA